MVTVAREEKNQWLFHAFHSIFASVRRAGSERRYGRPPPLLPVSPTQPSNVGFSSSNGGSVNCLDSAPIRVTAACRAKDSRLHLAGCRSDTLPPHRASSARKFHRLHRYNNPAEPAAPG